MESISVSLLFSILLVLLVLSAFFSSSETALMTINRYRLRHLAEQGNRSAILTEQLLEKPDKLIGLILLGNNLVNILAAQIVTLIALKLYGDYAIAIAGGIFTLVVLIFAEVTPKTIAALHAEKVAFPAAWVYWAIEKPFGPLVWALNLITNRFVRLFVSAEQQDQATNALSREELRTVVAEAGAFSASRYQNMLLNILDLNQVTVDDIMVPRHEINHIDLADDWSTILNQLRNNLHTRLLVIDGGIDNIVGLIHLRRIIRPLTEDKLDKTTLKNISREAVFVPEGTPLNKQLIEFQKQQRRMGLVVDEYGDLQGLVTLEDILEEIVGEFTSDPSQAENDIFPQEDGSFLVDGAANIRQLNRKMKWLLPMQNAKTVNGMVLDYLETIPEPGTSLLINRYPIEIVQTADNRIITIRISKRLKR